MGGGGGADADILLYKHKEIFKHKSAFFFNKSGADDKHSNSKIKYKYLWYSNVQRNHFCLNFATYKYN